MEWQLWIDYQRCDGDGLTHASAKDAEPNTILSPGTFIIVGNEDADPAVAEVVSLDDRGIILVRVAPGSLEENRHLLPQGLTSAN